ncbi:MAG TPA: glycosyltransferase [Candidatus Caldiarchaeum subterraneum]|uniref:Glycosyltransferase n=1 Tax=Caldiarchaeum subterraneum TaxID=311458 RepID=A0A832ZU36_CALS0|nr:glycosyltransferase [Aigarchaeota archaeon]HIQ29005.1 glycosyltransferase [Candidatus Caldarchaeum subterraneum]
MRVAVCSPEADATLIREGATGISRMIKTLTPLLHENCVKLSYIGNKHLIRRPRLSLIPYWNNIAGKEWLELDILWLHDGFPTTKPKKPAIITYHTPPMEVYSKITGLAPHQLLHYKLCNITEKKIIKTVLNKNNRVTVTGVSPYIVERFKEAGTEDVRYIPNAPSIKPASISLKEARRILNERYEIPEEGVFFLSIGRNDPLKNYRGLLRLWHLLKRRIPEAVLILAGRGTEKIRGPGVYGLGLKGEELPILYRACDAYVSLSLVEGMSLSLLDAINHEMKIILADVEPNSWLRDKDILLININNIGVDEVDRVIDYVGSSRRPRWKGPDWRRIAEMYKELFEEASQR